MFKKEKKGKTNSKAPKKGGDNIGFSFDINVNYIINSYFNFFKNKNTDYKFEI